MSINPRGYDAPKEDWAIEIGVSEESIFTVYLHGQEMGVFSSEAEAENYINNYEPYSGPEKDGE